MEPNWRNRTLWTGDNLPVMRGMNDESVDLIYLDPPFNSKRDYEAPIGSAAAGAAFKDTWTLSDLDLAWHAEIAEPEPAVYRIIEASRHAHGKGMMSYLVMMSVRLLEMRRLLKPTGSIYLHCDPTASHYLKAIMDAVFGSGNFRREIVWNLQTASGYKSQVRDWVRGHDTILFYARGRNFTFNKRFLPHKPEYAARFRKTDERGRRYRDDRPGGRRQYLDDTPGVALTDVWSDIMSFQQHSTAPERTGYPTQKPLALLDRIVAASSNEEDIVFDPFCGCATALVAAERLGRRWAGVDLSSLAVELVRRRLRDEMGIFYDVHHRTGHREEAPRTDEAAPEGIRPYNHVENKRYLFGKQEGHCAGCGEFYPFRMFEVDHVVPRSRGGGDDLANLQLLCGHCNRTKAARADSAFKDTRIRELEARLARLRASRRE